MQKIIENSGYFGVKYERIIGNKPHDVMVAGINNEYNDFTYMMVIGTNGQVYFESYKYLNVELAADGYSKRELSLRALKLLYSFIELFNTDINSLDIDDKNKIITFLKGGKGNGQYTTYDFKTVRKNETVNSYLGVYRSYFRYLGIKESIFEGTSESKKILTRASAFNSRVSEVAVKKYSISLNEIEKKAVPKYIKYSEYTEILKLINEKYTIRELLIVKLMYEYGLRIGEVLGLTLEDIQGEDITKKKGSYRLILRNRFTDKPWQFAKGCLKVTSRDVYKDNLYDEEGGGKQIINITYETYTLIQEYIDETTSSFSMSDKVYDNYIKKNIADKVSRVDIERNAYLFISKNYTPIVGGSWNKIMKNIFQEVGLQLDENKKKDNLNHRFRHGFAMYKVLIEKHRELGLARVLRHSSTSSVEVYFNPTEDDLIDFAIKQDDLTKRGINL
jgi:integrase